MLCLAWDLAQLGKFLLQRLVLFQQLLDGVGHAVRLYAQQRGRFVQGGDAFLDQLLGAAPGRHFHAAHPGRNAALVEDAEHADLGGAVHMRAAAELGADAIFLAKRDDTHFVAVLLAKERRHAFLERLLIRRPARVDGVIRQEDFVGAPLDDGEVLDAQRLAIGKVEAQPVGRHE